MQKALRNILVPVDFSPIARFAFRHAIEIARRSGARVTLVHVVEPYVDPLFVDSGTVTIGVKVTRDMHAYAVSRLQRMVRSASRRTRVKIDPLAVIGRFAPTVRTLSSEHRADLIVMGTHGATGFVEKLIGSNTYRVTALSSVPVLGVHKAIGRQGYSNLVYPVRSTRRALDKFPLALLFAKMFSAEVHVLGLLQTATPASERAFRTACAAVHRKFVRNGCAARTVFATQDTLVNATIRYAHKHPRSLVVINQDEDFRVVEMFQGTYSKNILHRVLSPVLTVPFKASKPQARFPGKVLV